MILIGWAACLPWSFVVIPLIDTGKPLCYVVAIVGIQAVAGIAYGPVAARSKSVTHPLSGPSCQIPNSESSTDAIVTAIAFLAHLAQQDCSPVTGDASGGAAVVPGRCPRSGAPSR
jgi:hypothetical protein